MLKTDTEQLWARHKYEIMMKGYDHYKSIQRLISDARTDYDYQTVRKKIDTLKKHHFLHAAVINTLEHVWGYFKQAASPTDKDYFFTFLNTCRNVTSDSYAVFPYEVKQTLSFLAWLLDQHPRPYLEQSSLFLSVKDRE